MQSEAVDQRIRPMIMDTDSNETTINGDEGRVRLIQNMQSGPPVEIGLGINEALRSTLLIPNPFLPTGNNTYVSAAEDQPNGHLYVFCYNDEEKHCVFRFLERERRWQKLYQSRHLDFNTNYFIGPTRFAMLANKFPTFTDAFNPPRS